MAIQQPFLTAEHIRREKDLFCGSQRDDDDNDDECLLHDYRY